MLKLIADSGSTKTDWVMLSDMGKMLATCHSQGLNPYHLSGEEISQVLCGVRASLLEQVEEVPVVSKNQLAIYFYGSGVTDTMAPKMERLLVEVFSDTASSGSRAWMEVKACATSDMLGAARALCGHQSGIAVILGTGSNSCWYDGKQMLKGVPPLGYILGDEGSGTAIGKAFLRLIFRCPEASRLKEKFIQWSGMDYAAIIDRVYRQPLANRFLASISTFVGETLEGKNVPSSVACSYEELERDRQVLGKMVQHVYDDFCAQVLSFYQKGENEILQVGFVGSIAYYFRDYIAAALRVSGFEMGEVLKSPLEGLVRYHGEE